MHDQLVSYFRIKSCDFRHLILIWGGTFDTHKGKPLIPENINYPVIAGILFLLLAIQKGSDFCNKLLPE